MFGICHVSSYEGEAPVRLQAALPKDVRDKIEQILLKSSTDIRIFVPLLLALSEYTDIQQAAADFPRKHWLRYWQKRSSAPLKEKTFRKFASQAAAV